MTRQQQKAYDFIKSYIEAHGFSPTYIEISEALGLKAKSGAHRIVHSLRTRGYVYIEPGHGRAVRLVDSRSSDNPAILSCAMAVAAAYDSHRGPTPEQIRDLVKAYRRHVRNFQVVA